MLYLQTYYWLEYTVVVAKEYLNTKIHYSFKP